MTKVDAKICTHLKVVVHQQRLVRAVWYMLGITTGDIQPIKRSEIIYLVTTNTQQLSIRACNEKASNSYLIRL